MTMTTITTRVAATVQAHLEPAAPGVAAESTPTTKAAVCSEVAPHVLVPAPAAETAWRSSRKLAAERPAPALSAAMVDAARWRKVAPLSLSTAAAAMGANVAAAVAVRDEDEDVDVDANVVVVVVVVADGVEVVFAPVGDGVGGVTVAPPVAEVAPENAWSASGLAVFPAAAVVLVMDVAAAVVARAVDLLMKGAVLNATAVVAAVANAVAANEGEVAMRAPAAADAAVVVEADAVTVAVTTVAVATAETESEVAVAAIVAAWAVTVLVTVDVVVVAAVVAIAIVVAVAEPPRVPVLFAVSSKVVPALARVTLTVTLVLTLIATLTLIVILTLVLDLATLTLFPS